MSSTKWLGIVVLLLAVNTAIVSANFKYAKAGTRIEDVESNTVIQGVVGTKTLNISLVVERVEFKPDSNTTLFYHALVYRDNSDSSFGKYYNVGPTIRVKRGDTITVNLTNEVVHYYDWQYTTGLQMAIANVTGGNGYKNSFATNLHLHGMHGSPGVLAQPTAPANGAPAMLLPASYTNGDNVLVQIPSMQTADSTPQYIMYKNELPEDHLPGMGWYHPHHHGGTSLQAATAKGVWVVEDDHDAWFSNDPDCVEFGKLLDMSKDFIVIISQQNFGSPVDPPIQDRNANQLVSDTGDYLSYDDLAPNLDFPNYQFMSLASNDTFCCDDESEFPNNLDNSNYVFVNGAYQPIITMKAGIYERWRFVNVANQAFMSVQFLKDDLSDYADCTMALYSKDSVYLMDLPRVIPAALLAMGSRAEVVVRCNGVEGETVMLTTGMGPSPVGDFAACDDSTPADQCVMPPQLLATIELIAPDAKEVEAQPAIAEETCHPLRPAYAADLTDDNIAELGVADRVVDEGVSLTDNPAFGCLVNNMWFSFPVQDPIVMELGTIVQVTWQYLDAHATHIHINPFQLVSLPEYNISPGTKYSSYYKVGDYHDTLMMLQLVPGNNVTARIQPGPYTGYAVVHCHILPHEDSGCMKIVQWKCPGYGNEQPFPCPNFEFPIPGTVNATMYPDNAPDEPVDVSVTGR